MKYGKETEKFEVQTNFLNAGMMLKGPAYTEQGEKIVDAFTPITLEQIRYLKSKNIKIIYYTTVHYKMKESLDNFLLEETTIDTAVSLLDQIQSRIREEGEKCHINPNDVSQVVGNFITNIKSRPDACLNLLDLIQYDDYTYTHSINVASLSILMGMSMGMDESKVLQLGISGLLHDIGKTQINPAIINKPRKLDEQEWKIMRQHPVLGYKIIRNQKDILPGVDKVVLCHHESFDGMGYPLGLGHDKLPALAQIVSLSDVFDSLTSKRTYKSAWTYAEAYSYFMEVSGTKFNPRLTQVFLRDMARKLHEKPVFPVDAFVELNTGEVARVVDHHQYIYTLRPVIEVLMNEQNMPLIRPLQVDLEKDPGRHIIRRVIDAHKLKVLETSFQRKVTTCK